MDTSSLRLVVTKHANKVIHEKGFDPYDVWDTFVSPKFETPVSKYPDQTRLIGNGLALVGREEGDEFVLITVYLDRVLTPPRPDQLTTPEGMRYAARWEQGLGRG